MAYLGNFGCKRDVLQGFSGYGNVNETVKNDLKDSKILLAWYGSDYDGSAFVLFDRDGQLFEVNGSHCSCYGLEDQWDPEETTVAALRHRITEGYLGQDGCYDEGVFDVTLKKILTRWERTHCK